MPVSLLLDPSQTASAKVVWIVLSTYPAARPAELERLTGLSRHTVLIGLRRARANKALPGGPQVKIPLSLLGEQRVCPQAKVLYGLLQATPDFREEGGQFTFTSLCALTKLDRNTLKRAVRQLVGAGWIQISQVNRLRPIHFTLGSADLRRSQAEAAVAQQRLERAQFRGEALMQEYLSLLIDSDQFTDNARPGFLVNPETKERLELNRYYPVGVAFEFHGTVDYGATDRFAHEQADDQLLRALIKAGICVYQDIQLVVVHTKELSLEGMIKKIGQSLPLRSLDGHEPLIELLERKSLLYRSKVRRTQRARR